MKGCLVAHSTSEFQSHKATFNDVPQLHVQGRWDRMHNACNNRLYECL